MDTAFCPTCQVIQPTTGNVDYFRLFSLQFSFSLAVEQLEENYQSLQRQFHPDRFASRSATERRLSLEHVTRINQAYQTIRDPLLRSEYLLERLGYRVADPGQSEPQDPAFLMEVMEQREALEAVDLSAAGAAQQLGRMREETERCLEQDEAQLARLFASCLPAEAGREAVCAPELRQQIVRVNHRLRYHRRFLEALDQAEENISEQGV
ncbi:MAG: Fe-S protein assembly co-chaperone HscB [Magnetococcales bacterium]|nr:Fe-S protein assembly co-chaperone HscB [Magnetococcales bacterium]